MRTLIETSEVRVAVYAHFLLRSNVEDFRIKLTASMLWEVEPPIKNLERFNVEGAAHFLEFPMPFPGPQYTLLQRILVREIINTTPSYTARLGPWRAPAMISHNPRLP